METHPPTADLGFQGSLKRAPVFPQHMDASRSVPRLREKLAVAPRRNKSLFMSDCYIFIGPTQGCVAISRHTVAHRRQPPRVEPPASPGGQALSASRWPLGMARQEFRRHWRAQQASEALEIPPAQFA